MQVLLRMCNLASNCIQPTTCMASEMEDVMKQRMELLIKLMTDRRNNMKQMMDMMGEIALRFEKDAALLMRTASKTCTGKVFTEELHNQRADCANPDDNADRNIKSPDKEDMPQSGDVMMYMKDTTHGQTNEYTAHIQDVDIPKEIRNRYSPFGFVRCARAARRTSGLRWKMNVETSDKNMEEPRSLKSNEMAKCNFQPQQPMVCDALKNYEGSSVVTLMDGSGVGMPG